MRPAILIAALLIAPAACTAVDVQADLKQDARDQVEGPVVHDRDCGDDQGNDRCSSEAQRRMRELYGIADAETLSAQGVLLRRTMMVDGYGQDVVAITFSRAPGRPPTVEIATPQEDAGPKPQPLTAVVDLDTWRQVLDASRDFDQQLVRELPGVRDPLASLCLHSWFVVVEAVDPAHLSQRVVGQYEVPAKIRRDAEDACNDGLAMRYAFELARIAREQLPECSSLRGEDFRNDATLLALCHRLGGDRMAASDAYRFLKKLGRRDIQPEAYRFATSATQLKEAFGEALKGGYIYFGAPEATDLDHASVDGQVSFPDGEDFQVADLKLKLVRQNNGFVILSYELSRKRPNR